MSGLAGVTATRLALLRTQRRLARVEKGSSILRRKREALVTQLFTLARPATDTREQIAGKAVGAYSALLAALAAHGASGLRSVGWPDRDLRVEISHSQVWGIPVADIVERPPVARTLAARGTAPGSGPAAAEAAREFEALAELLLEAAPRESLIRRLGEALARTSRQVNTLERRVGPSLRQQTGAIRRTLEEREREDRARLKHLMRMKSM